MAQGPKKKKKAAPSAAVGKKTATKKPAAKKSAAKRPVGRKVTPAAAKKRVAAKKAPAKKAAKKATATKPPGKPGRATTGNASPPPRRRGEMDAHCQDQLVPGSDGKLHVKVLNPRFSGLWTAPPSPADPNPTLDQYIVMVNRFLRDGNAEPPFALSICVEVAGQEITINEGSAALLTQLTSFLQCRLTSILKVCTC
jgi:hypothetical protein